MTRALGVDLGSRRIGLALSDSALTTAVPHRALERSGDRGSDHDAILAAAAEHEVDVVVVGLPLGLDGEVGTAARQVLSEVDELRRAADDAIRVEVADERLSTVSAEAALRDAGVSGRERRRRVDQSAAAVILQAWLDARGS